MKERALQLVKETPEPQKANLLREYLQAHILYSLQGKRAFEQLRLSTAPHSVSSMAFLGSPRILISPLNAKPVTALTRCSKQPRGILPRQGLR